MNFLSPPTDSLYKFIAVGGLILFLTGTYITFERGDNEWDTLYKQYGEERILEKETHLLMDELKYNLKYKKFNDSILNTLKGTDVLYVSIANDSLPKKLLYSLPDSFQNKFRILILKKERLDINHDFIYSQQSNRDLYFWIYLLALILGEIMGLFGLVLWYFSIQKPLDDEQKQKKTQSLLQGENFAEDCQSCLKTFFFIKERGTEVDGGMSKLFCSECYSNGSFVEPTLTIDEASDRLKKKLTNLKYKDKEVSKHIKLLRAALRWKREKLW